jgi:MoaA/NifB/PqqE/SkfB family radical SAM enzyme
LQCLHCYSSSGPHERGELPLALLADALTRAGDLGYNAMSVSGGEPLLYSHLRELLEHARRCGMVTALTTNGMLLDARRIALLRGVVDVLAISLDGVPESHNRMRASPHAFPMMASRLAGLREADIPFGFIFTLTQYNVHELDWVANFALEQGARVLQIHPLEEVGRAAGELPGGAPDEIEATFAYLEAARIQQVAGQRLTVQLDFASRQVLLGDPGRAFAASAPDAGAEGTFADLVSPLIVEPDGTVVPLQFGFARALALGNLYDYPLDELAACWRRERYDAFQAVCRRVFDQLTAPAGRPLVNWYEEIARQAERDPVRVRHASAG